jgi:hypothetical protein
MPAGRAASLNCRLVDGMEVGLVILLMRIDIPEKRTFHRGIAIGRGAAWLGLGVVLTKTAPKCQEETLAT